MGKAGKKGGVSILRSAMGWETDHVTRHGCGCYTVTVSHDSFLGRRQERHYCPQCRERLREECEQRIREEEEERERRDNAAHRCAKCKQEVRAIDMGYTKRGSVYLKCVGRRGPPRARKALRKRR